MTRCDCCPACGSKGGVTETRTAELPAGAIKRTRKCDDCGEQWHGIEVSVEWLDGIMRSERTGWLKAIARERVELRRLRREKGGASDILPRS